MIFFCFKFAKNKLTILYPSYKMSKMRPFDDDICWTLCRFCWRYGSCLHFNNFDLDEFLWKVFSRLALKGTWLDQCCHKTHKLHDCKLSLFSRPRLKGFQRHSGWWQSPFIYTSPKLFKAMPGNCRQVFTQDGLQSLCWSPQVVLSNAVKKGKKRRCLSHGPVFVFSDNQTVLVYAKGVSPMMWLPVSFALGKRRSNRWTNWDSEKCERARFCW